MDVRVRRERSRTRSCGNPVAARRPHHFISSQDRNNTSRGMTAAAADT